MPKPPTPALHTAVMCVAAPSLAISGPDGQLRGVGLDGYYRDGVRLVSRLRLRLAGAEPLPVQERRIDAGRTRFVAVQRAPGDAGPDPAVTIERVRRADGVERITVHQGGPLPLRAPLEIDAASDLAQPFAPSVPRPVPPGGPDTASPAPHVRSTGPLDLPLPAPRPAAPDPAAPPSRPPAGPGRPLCPRLHPGGLRWFAGDSGADHGAVLTARPTPHEVTAAGGRLRWNLDLPPGARWTVEIRIEPEWRSGTTRRGTAAARRAARPRAFRGGAPWSSSGAPPVVECAHPHAAPLLRNSLDDLRALLLADPDRPTDAIAAAGAPWRFGPSPAEALWAARLLLPLGTRLAAGTLRTLARRQAVAAPGRRAAVPGCDAGADTAGGALPGTLRHAGPALPPAWTGSEATLLFVTVLAEAVRWGLPASEAEPLLPAAGRCLEWLRNASCADGLVRDPPTGQAPPVARCEIQAMAHRAALQGADLLDTFNRSGAASWRDWAAAFRTRFTGRFWIDDASAGGGPGPRPAIALRADGRPIDAPGAQLAHLLDTGLLAGGVLGEGLLGPERTGLLADLLTGPDLDSGWGLRSLGPRSPRFAPLSHRGGAVRPADTALAVAGLCGHGFGGRAAALAGGLLDAAAQHGDRLPEMYGGEQRNPGSAPLPHPAACRPDGPTAASAVQLLTAAAGLRPDAPESHLTLRPAAGALADQLRIGGLHLAGAPLAVRIDADGTAVVDGAPQGFSVTAPHPAGER